MGYGNEIYQEALQIVRERRLKAEAAYRETYSKLAEIRPDIADIDRELAALGVKAAKAAASGENVLDIKKCYDELNQKRGQILSELGISPERIAPIYECKKCSDTGYVNGSLCSCVKRLARDISYSRLNSMAPAKLSDFSSFNLDYYSDKPLESGAVPSKVMTDNFMFAMEYASNFNMSAKSVLFMGPTGLGKTHLSLAIAKAVIDKNYGVIYGSAQNFIRTIEKEHFKNNSDAVTLDALLECDLLIFDDLGTEFNTSFSVSVMYNIINTRLLYSRPTIISTNLTLKEIEERYGERILSRIIGGYYIKKFCGEDIRKIKAFG
ncbi:MAG TPA: ATP-binding protein [Firmicutes bacterium]|nr:ATP-binding protein [Bacillota bacterium]